MAPAAALPNVVIVGAGITGSVLAAMTKEMGFATRVVEKSRGAGGRMSTHRVRGGSGGREEPVVGRADLGAQYITTRSPPEHPVLGSLYASLLDAGVLRPFTGEVAGPNPYGGASAEVRHFSAPQGLQTVAEHFLKQSGAEVHWDTALGSLDILENGSLSASISRSSDGSELSASDIFGSGGADGPPSVVVLTQPVAQVLGKSRFPVSGNFLSGLDASSAAALDKVEYSSRFAAAYFFDSKIFSWPHSWSAHYFEKGDVRYVAHDTGKRGATTAEASMVSVVVHSGVPLGIEFKDESSPFDAASARLLADLQQKLPEVPWEKASHTKVHKWLYSQVYKGTGGKRPAPDWVWAPDAPSVEAAGGGFPGACELFRTERTFGLLAGDAMAPASNFEGCVYSARRTADAIRAYAESLSAESHRSDL